MSKKKILIILFFLCVIVVGAYSLYQTSLSWLRPKIAIVPIKGEIGPSFSILSQATPASSIISKLEKAEKDPFVRGIILEINSPGGSIVSTRRIERKVNQIDKPIVALLEDTAASGAYWIASATDQIVSDPFTMTGSIGVSASYLEYSGLLKKLGVEYVRLVKGKRKDIGSPYRNLTPEDREILERYLNLSYQTLVKKISENRQLDPGHVRDLATGEPILGLDAKKKGLVDQLGGRKEAVEIVSNLANVTKPKITYYKKELGVLGLFKKLFTSTNLAWIEPYPLVLDAART